MTDMPLISVLMTAYNRENFIAEAIESVLTSTHRSLELIIVDDGSKDRTVSIAREYEAKDPRVRVYVNEKNLGDYPNRNRAATYAKGKYLKYVDSDDMIFPNTLEYMVGLMEQYPDAAFGVSSRSQSTSTYLTPYEAYYTHFFVRGLLDHGPTAVIMRKSAFDLYGEFKHIRNVSDLDMWLRLAARCPVIEMKKDLIFWREHEGQEIRLDEFKYIEFQLPIITDHVMSNACPLTGEQKEAIIKKHKKFFTKRLLKRIIRGQNVRACLRVWREQELSLTNLF